jgi:preprotein translocase subunit Sec61beta
VTFRFHPRLHSLVREDAPLKRYSPLVFFVGGFLWDSLTLTRIDRVMDNVILLGYLLLMLGLIVLVQMADAGRVRQPFLLRFRRFYPLGIQFFLGGLMSSYVVFYFKSASMTRTSLFLVLLVLLLVANEFLEKRLSNLTFQVGFLFFSAFTFLVFFIPVATGVMNVFTFVAAGLLSLMATAGVLRFFEKRGVFSSRRALVRAGSAVAGLFILMNVFYALNWMPPVPLSLKSGGVYHRVERKENAYLLAYRKPPWYRFWQRDSDPFLLAEDDRVYCFSAVFAPIGLTKGILHHWERYDEEQRQWRTTDRLAFDISGGRAEGYRGYTFKRNVTPGRWRVDVKTEDDLIIGRVAFQVVPSEDDERRWRTVRY